MAGTDFGVNFAAGLAVNIVTAVGRQARYCYQFKELVADLGDEQKTLISTRDGMQCQLEKDNANSKETLQDLQRKVTEATELINQVDKLKEKVEAKQSCCHGVCPNLMCRYVVGKKAKEKTEAMKKLIEKLTPKLSRAHRLSLRCVPLSEDFILFKCTEEAYNEILKTLRDDKKKRIGLYGMGGCGKTSLLRKVHMKLQDSKLYKTAFVVVSNPPKYLDIQDSIATWIGLEFKTEKNVHDRAARLTMTFDAHKKYIIILDNVWRELDFSAIGIPVGAHCKVLLSCRQRHLFDLMEFDAGIYLSLLEKDEAWKLFQKHVGEINNPSQEKVAREIVDECYGLPIAIKAMANTLRGKGHHAWINALETLKDRTEPLKIDEEGLDDPYRCLKYSFDELKDPKDVSLFLLCAVFPNNSEIAIEVLIRFAFGLCIFKDTSSYQRARAKVRTTIDKFKDHCLVLQEGEYVKLHDMFHALALWEANNKTQVIMEPSQIVKLTEEVHMKYTNRLYCHGIEEFPDQLNCPELEILIVSNNGGCSPKFLDMLSKMKKLKVLAITNTSIETKPDLVLPQSMQELKKLRTLCLRGWTLINISMFERLEMLDTIELLDCVIEELPKQLANMKALKLFEVSNCKVGGDPYKVVSTCSHLEELYFVDNEIPEMVLPIGHINVAEFFQQIGTFKELQRYHLGIGGFINTWKDHSSSKLMSVNDFDASSLTNEAFRVLSKTLEVLLLKKIQGDSKSIIPDMFPIQGHYLNELKEFALHDSDCIKYLIDTTNHQLNQTTVLFANLQKLKVEAMKFLEDLCHGPPPSCLFDNLKELFVTNCNQLASLLTTAAAQNMVMLEVLEVTDCDNLRYMVKVENEDEDVSVGPMLPRLKQISVKKCKNLKCVLPISIASGLLQLESLEIEDATELQYVFGYDDNEKGQNQKQICIDLSAVKLKLINLPIISSIYPQYNHVKQQLDKPVVKGCPRLSGTFGLDSEVGDEAMEQVELLSMSSGEDLRFNPRVRTAKDLVQATVRQARFIYRFHSFVTDLIKERDLLISKFEPIFVSAEPLGDPQLEEARDLIEKVKILERKAEESKSCCNGVFTNWFCRYSVGKRLEGMTKTVKQFNERLPVKPQRVLSEPSMIHRDNFIMFESIKEPYNEILKALKDDEIYMIGLYGRGGCGKTTLIKQMCKEENALKLFDVVAMVCVSSEPNIKRIQSEIAELMGMSLEEESEIGRASRLSMRLNNGDKILMILDDMWGVLKLEQLGIPLGKNCKVILTTRHQHLCTMMGCQKTVYLSLLSEKDAWNLFQKSAGVTQGELKDLALQILRECQGLPIAIVAIATTLKNKPEDDWKHAIERLRKPKDLSSDMKNIFDILKLSIDYMADEARSLFYLCALFPEDSNISLEILIRFASGLSIFKDVDSYERARIKVGAIIHELIHSNSLLLGDGKRQYFHMHDLIREAALFFTKKIQVIMGPKDNLTAITEGDYMKDTTRLYCHLIKEYPKQLNCPKLEFLLVSNDSGYSSEFSDYFFIEMIELKVLAIIDTSIWTTPNLFLPQSMYGLKKIRTVCLRGLALNNISILGVLETLDTIELLYCVIKELPEEFAKLTRLRLLEVSGCKIQSNPFEMLSRCSQLEELYFVENNLLEMWSNDHNVVKLLHEIGSSKALQRYHLEIGSSIDTLENDDLIKKFISINGFNIPASDKEMKNVAQKLEVLFLKTVHGDCKNIFPDMLPIDGEWMNELTELSLQDSDNIECFIDTRHHPVYQAPAIVFSRLLKLKIKTMKCFEALCRGLPHSNLFEKLEELFIVECSQLQCIVSVGKLNFCNLKHLKLEDCPKLTHVFTYSTAKTMVSLKILKAQDCISLKKIIKDEEEVEITPVAPIFPKLKQVIVKGCPHLEFIIPASFCCGLPQLSIISDSEVAIQQGGGKSSEQEWELPEIQSSNMVVRSVEDINVEECKMEGIFQLTKPAIDMESKSLFLSCLQSLVMVNLPDLRYIQEGHKQLHNLRRVRIYKCEELKCIFSLRMMTFISALQELIIEECSQVEQIIQHDYYDGQYTGPFSDNCNLQKIIVKSCTKLESLFTVSTAKALRLIKTLKIEECPGMKFLLKDENAEAYKSKEIIEEDGEQAIFPNLSFLSLKNLPEFIHVCEGDKLKAVKGVMFPESFNPSNLQILTVKSCPRLRSLFTVSTAKTLTWLTSLEIIDCSALECVIRGKSKKIAQSDAKEMLPKLNILHLVKLPCLIIIHRDIKLQCEPCHVQDCPKLKQTFSDNLKPDGFLQDFESPEDEEDYHDDDGEDMDKNEEQHKEVEYATQEDNSIVIEKTSRIGEESKEVDEAAVGNPYVDSLSPTMASVSSEVVANYKDKEVPSHSGSTNSNEEDKEIQRDNNDIPTGSITTVQAAEEAHAHTHEIEIDQEGLLKTKFCPVHLMNLHESSKNIGKESLHKDIGLEESKVRTSTQVLLNKQLQVELDANFAKVQDSVESREKTIMNNFYIDVLNECIYTECESLNINGSSMRIFPKQKFCPVDSMNLQERSTKIRKGTHHEDTGLEESNVRISTQRFNTQDDFVQRTFCSAGSVNSRESNTGITKVSSLHKDPAPEESAVGTSSQVLIDKQPQIVTGPQQGLQEYKASLPRSVEELTSSSANQHPLTEELVDFHSLFKIKEGHAHLLEEAFVKYPHLWEWKLSQQTFRICKMGYKSLADMLAFLKSETPKTMDKSKMEKFEDLYYELEYFRFDKMWLTSIRQRVIDMQADHNNKLKKMDQLESQIGNLEEQLSDVRASLASVKDDLSKPSHVFGI